MLYNNRLDHVSGLQPGDSHATLRRKMYSTQKSGGLYIGMGPCSREVQLKSNAKAATAVQEHMCAVSQSGGPRQRD